MASSVRSPRCCFSLWSTPGTAALSRVYRLCLAIVFAAMSRAMGDFSYKGNQSLPPHLQKVIPNPDITTETAYSGDSLLVCCDGIVEQLTSEQVANFVHRQMQELPPGADSASASAAGDAASPSAPSASSANSDSASGTAARSASPAPSSKASPAVTHPMDPAMVCAQLLE